MTTSDSDFAVSDTLHHAVLRSRAKAGPYGLVRIIGTGGMGVVHEGVAPDGKRCAIKTLRADLIDERAAKRFAREAAVRIEHPNVIRVLDAGEDEDGTPYIVFELLQGQTFEDRMKRRDLTIDEAVDVVLQACDGVAAAHEAGIVHRDLKPANLFIEKSGRVKVLDFGIAGLATGPKMTATGQLLGTPAYLAPEQARSTSEADARADVWALGAVLYEALAGAPPFEGDSFFATVLSILMEPVPPLAARAPEAPRALVDVVMRCLTKDRDARYQNARALAAALSRAKTGAPAHTLAPATRRVGRATGIPVGEDRVVVVVLAEGVRDHAKLEEIIAAHGGEPATRFGGSALGLFGASRWVGDEAMRAVNAAIECRPLATRVSVASGRAAASDSGLAGGAVSRAERGCRADVTGIALDADTARSVQSRYTVQRIDDAILELVEERPPSWLAPRVVDADLVFGREAQIATMRFALSTALAEGHAMVVAVTGPAGIGKTAMRRSFERLLEEESVPTTVLAARAEPLYQETPWSYLASLLRRHSALRVAESGWPRIDPAAPRDERCDGVLRLAAEAIDDPGAAAECAEFLGELLGVPMPETVRLRAARAEPRLMGDRIRLSVSDWLQGHASKRAVALLLDDVDWADATSLDVLEQVIDDLSDTPLVVFASSRKNQLVEGRSLFSGLDTVHVKLSGVPKNAVAALAARVAGHDLPDAVVDLLAERTEGNPLFVQEIVLALAEQGRLDEARLTAEPLPLSIEAAVQSRLDLLTPEEREAVKRASVYGRPFSVDDLRGTGVEAAEHLVAQLRSRDIVTRHVGGRGPRQYGFRSSLVGEVAYRMIEKDARAALHRRVAIHLATTDDTDPAEVARHLDLGESPEAANWWATAAIADAKRGDSASVLRSSERSLALGASSEQLWKLRMARAEALRFLLRRDEQHDELEAALAVAKDDAERAETRRQLAFWLQRSAKLGEAVEMARLSAGDADSTGDARLRALTRCTLAQAMLFSGDGPGAESVLAEADSLAPEGDPGVRAQVAEARGICAVSRGDVADARAAFAVCVEHYGIAGNVREAAVNEQNLADSYNRIAAWGEARDALSEAIAGCRRVKNRVGEAYALANLGYSLAKLGRVDDALESLEEARRLAEEMKDTRLLAALLVYRAHAFAAGGDAKLLSEEAERAALEAASAGLTSYGAVALALAARGRLSLGQIPAALELSRRALALRDELGGVEEDEAEIFLVRAQVLAAAGEGEEERAVRRRGAARIAEIAARISDPELRARFVGDVPANRELSVTSTG